MIGFRVVLLSRRKKKIEERLVELYKRVLLYYRNHGLIKFCQRLLQEPVILLKQSLRCRRFMYVLVETDPQKPLPSILSPTIPVNVGMLNKDILDNNDTSLLGDKAAILENIKCGDKYFVACYKNIIIGYVLVSFQNKTIPWHMVRLKDKEAHWTEMFTSPGYQGKGVIPQVVYAATNFLKAHGYQRVIGIFAYDNKSTLRTAQRFQWSIARKIIRLRFSAIEIILI